MAFLQGFLVGLAMVIFVGPVLFTLLQATLHKGRQAGIAVALGIFVSDIIVALLCYHGFGDVLTMGENRIYVAGAGCIILLFMGLKYLLIQPKSEPKTNASKATPFVHGFLVNFVNPFVFAVWIGVISLMQTKFNETSDHYVYMGAIILGVLSTDLVKVVLAHRLNSFLSTKHLRSVYRICGILMVVFAIRLGYYAIVNLPT